MKQRLLYWLFACALPLFVLLGDSKQSTVLVICSAWVIGQYLYHLLVQKKVFWLETPIALHWGIFTASFLIAAIGSSSIALTITELIKYILAFLIVISVSNTVTGGMVTKASRYYLIATSVLCALSFIFFSFPVLQLHIPRMNLLTISYGHNHLIDLLFFAVPIGAHFFLVSRSRWLLLPLILFGLVFITSFSRGGTALLLGYIAYLSLAYGKHNSVVRKSMYTCVIGCVVIVLFAVFSSSTVGRWVITNSDTGFYKSTLLNSRLLYWQQAISALKTRPLAGWGPGTFMLTSRLFQQSPDSYSWFAHSLPLQIAAEFGILGLLAISALVYVQIKPRLKREVSLSETPVSLYKAIQHGVVLTLVYSFVEMNLDFTLVWVVFWVWVGVLIMYQSGAAMRKRIVPNTLVWILVSILGVYYISYTGASLISLSPKYSYIGILLEPHNAQRVKDELFKHKSIQLHPLLENALIILHKENPEILFALATHFDNNNSLEKAKRYYVLTKKVDPMNIEYFRARAQFYIRSGQYRSFFEEYKEKLLAKQSQELVGAIRDINFSDTDIRQPYRNDLTQRVRVETLSIEEASINLFLFGLAISETDHIESEKMFILSRNLSPGWSQFHLALAAYYEYIKGDTVSAKQTLIQCLHYSEPSEHCEEVLRLSIPSLTEVNEYVYSMP